MQLISGIGSVAVLVNDAKKSAEWYHNKLGFEIIESAGHIVFVRAPGSQSLIHLCAKCGDWGEDKPGGRTGIWLSSGQVLLRKDPSSGRILPMSDPEKVEETYHELKNKGVEFSEPLIKTSWGKMAILRDPDGNEFEIS